MITLENVSKVFGTGVAGLSDINLQIDKGEFVFLVGHTGSGKTTLLRMLIREVAPTNGRVIVGGWDLSKLPGSKIPHLRKKIGVVFQDLKLLMDRTIHENIMLPLQVAGIDKSEAHKRTQELLEHVGIAVHKDKFPVQLSGGELQRAAIARALTLSPDILLADEPTGNLDAQTAFGIVDLLAKINQHGTTIVMATHNMDIVGKLGKRVVMLEKGKLVKDEKKGPKIPKEPEVSKETKESKETSADASSFAKASNDKKAMEDKKGTEETDGTKGHKEEKNLKEHKKEEAKHAASSTKDHEERKESSSASSFAKATDDKKATEDKDKKIGEDKKQEIKEQTDEVHAELKAKKRSGFRLFNRS